MTRPVQPLALSTQWGEALEGHALQRVPALSQELVLTEVLF